MEDIFGINISQVALVALKTKVGTYIITHRRHNRELKLAVPR